MAIERKDRSFDRIFEEVSLERVPMDYVMTVKIFLTDGSSIEIDKDQLDDITSETQLLGDIDRADVADIAISLDYESIKDDVSSSVKDVLSNFFKSDDE